MKHNIITFGGAFLLIAVVLAGTYLISSLPVMKPNNDASYSAGASRNTESRHSVASGDNYGYEASMPEVSGHNNSFAVSSMPGPPSVKQQVPVVKDNISPADPSCANRGATSVQSVQISSSSTATGTPSSQSDSQEAVPDPVIITDNICYEWSEQGHTTLYVALQLKNIGSVPIEVTKVVLTLYSGDTSVTVDANYATKIILPGEFGYSATFYYFDNPTSEQYFKSVLVNIEQRTTALVRRDLEIYDLAFYKATEKTSLLVDFSICNQFDATVKDINIEIILLDANDRFIGVFINYFPQLYSQDGYSRQRMATTIYSNTLSGNLVKICGSAYVCDRWG